jgi:hypothetical protein
VYLRSSRAGGTRTRDRRIMSTLRLSAVLPRVLSVPDRSIMCRMTLLRPESAPVIALEKVATLFARPLQREAVRTGIPPRRRMSRKVFCCLLPRYGDRSLEPIPGRVLPRVALIGHSLPLASTQRSALSMVGREVTVGSVAGLLSLG